MNKGIKRWIAAGTIGVMLAAAMLYAPAALQSMKGETALAAESAAAGAAGRTITVSGEGTITIQPDVAYVTFGVVTKAAAANEAQQQNASAFAAIEKVLKEDFAVESRDVKTSGFQVRPEYDYSEKGQGKITGYTATHSVVVTYRDLEGLGQLLDAVSKAGANSVNGVQFGTEKADEYELQAIEKAMSNAKQKADTIAKSAGRSVTGVLHVQQGSVSGAPTPYPMVRAELAMMDSASGTSVQPGELEITTTVQVTYEM